MRIAFVAFLFTFTSLAQATCPEDLNLSVSEARAQLEQAREMAGLLNLSLVGSDNEVSTVLARLEKMEQVIASGEVVDSKQTVLTVARAGLIGRMRSPREVRAEGNVRARETLREPWGEFQFL